MPSCPASRDARKPRSRWEAERQPCEPFGQPVPLQSGLRVRNAVVAGRHDGSPWRGLHVNEHGHREIASTKRPPHLALVKSDPRDPGRVDDGAYLSNAAPIGQRQEAVAQCRLIDPHDLLTPLLHRSKCGVGGLD